MRSSNKHHILSMPVRKTPRRSKTPRKSKTPRSKTPRSKTPRRRKTSSTPKRNTRSVRTKTPAGSTKKAKVKRGPNAANHRISEQMHRLNKEFPHISHTERFQMAVKAARLP